MTDEKEANDERMRAAVQEAVTKALDDPRLRKIMLTLISLGPDDMFQWLAFLCDIINNKVDLHEAKNAMQLGLGAVGTIERAIQKQVKMVMMTGMPDPIKKEDIN